MYEVTTILKTLIKTADLDAAMAIAAEAAKTCSYVAVKRIITETPWYTESVKIFR